MKRPSLGTSLRPSTAARMDGRTSTMPRRESSLRGTAGAGTMMRGMSMSMRGGETMAHTSRPPTKRDDRPLDDPQWRRQEIDKLIKWLIDHDYQHSDSKFFKTHKIEDIGLNGMTTLTEFIVKSWSPNFKLSAKRDDDALKVFQMLHYPYNLKKDHFSPHSVSNCGKIIGALSWLLQLDELFHSDDNKEDPILDRLWFVYLVECFSSDGQPEKIEKSKEVFREGLKKQIDSLQRIEEETNAAAEENKERIEKEEELIRNGEEIAEGLQGHIQKMEKEERDLREETQFFERSCVDAQQEFLRLREEEARMKADLDKIDDELARLKSKVEKQGISPKEHKEMVKERDAQQQKCDRLSVTRQERCNEVQEAKSVVSDISSRLQQQMLSYEKTIIGMSLTDLALRFEPGSENGEERLLEAVKRSVKPKVKAMIQKTRDDMNAEIQAQFVKQEELLRLRKKVESLETDISDEKEKIQRLEQDHETVRENDRQTRKKQDETLRRMRADCERNRDNASQAYNEAQTAVMGLNQQIRIEREKQRAEIAQHQARITKLCKELIDANEFIGPLVDDVLAQSSHFAEVAQQYQQDATPDIVAAESFSFAYNAQNMSSVLLTTPGKPGKHVSIAFQPPSTAKKSSRVSSRAATPGRALRH